MTREHLPQADAEEQPILIHALRPESGDMEGIGYKRLGKDRNRRIDSCRRIFLNEYRHFYFLGIYAHRSFAFEKPRVTRQSQKVVSGLPKVFLIPPRGPSIALCLTLRD